MQNPLKITFHNIEPSQTVEDQVMRRIIDLEKRFDRIIGCEVVIDAPQKRQAAGRDFKVHLNLHLPGPDISTTSLVGRGSAADNVSLALHKAFSAAARKLVERKRQMAGH